MIRFFMFDIGIFENFKNNFYGFCLGFCFGYEVSIYGVIRE